jgi:predicted small metal-binding protein
MTVYSYACKDYPGMEACPGQFHAQTEAELMKLIELHAKLAHNENPDAWSPGDRNLLKALIVAKA